VGLAVAGEGARTFCTFRVGEGLYGIEMSLLREVSRQTQVTPMPQAPRVIRGLTNVRSTIVLVIDLRPLLGLEPVETTLESRLILLKPSVAENLGLLADSGGDVRVIPEDRIEYRAVLAGEGGTAEAGASGLEGAAAGAGLIAGTAKLEDALMMIIDPTRFESSIEFLVR
jgi:purine-binding chemotaxis protein CheW